MSDSKYHFRQRSYPISVNVLNDVEKGHGISPEHFSNLYMPQLGRKVIVNDDRGRAFEFRMVYSNDSAVATNGWLSFLNYWDLNEKLFVVLDYFGHYFFTFNPHKQEDIESFSGDENFEENSTTSGSLNSDNPNSSSMTYEFSLTRYFASKYQKHLPSSFVELCLNLHLKTVTLRLANSREWVCDIYIASRGINEARLSLGWRSFCSDLKLKEGDKVTFECIDR